MQKTTRKTNDFYEQPRTLEEVAQYFGLSSRFIRQQVYDGHLRALKLSHTVVRIRPEDIREWEERAKTTKETKSQ